MIAENGLQDTDGIVYIQITRGAAPRKHAFPDAGTPPTVYVTTKAFPRPANENFANGVATISLPDTRWGRCDIKSVGLLPNVLANQRAKEAGAFEAIFVRDGVLIEGNEDGFHLILSGGRAEYNFRIHGVAVELLKAVQREIGPWYAEGEAVLRELKYGKSRPVFECVPDESAGLAEAYADAADLARKREKGE